MSNFPSQIDPLDPTATLGEEAVAEAAVEAHRAKRNERIKRSLLTALLVRPLSFLVPLVTVPLFLRYLGVARYGLWESVSALGMWLGITNLGLGMGLMNRLIECDVRNDRETARLCTSTLMLAMTALCIASMVAFGIGVWFVPWAWLLGAHDPAARDEATISVLIAGMISFLGLLASIPGNIYSGYQETDRNNLWEGAARIAMLIACVTILLWPSLGTAGALIASLGVPTLVRLVNLVDLFTREKPWLRPSLRLFDFDILKWMASQGLLLFILGLSALLLFQTNNLIIGKALGSQAVTGYAIVGRIMLMGYGVFMLFITPIWPAMGEAVRRGDLAWVRVMVRRLSLLGMGMMLVGGLALLFGRGSMSYLLRRFSGGEEVALSNSLILAMTLTFVTRAWIDSRSIVLNATGVLLPQIPFYGGHALLNAIVAIAVVRRWGVEGVAWGTAITGLVTSVWGYPWMIRRYIMTDRRGSG